LTVPQEIVTAGVRTGGGRYLVAATKTWNRQVFNETISRYPGDWHFVSDPQELTLEFVRSLQPHKIFFLHWSWKVPADIVRHFECVLFHMTDLPYGRGGSPLQNLISAGHRHTKVTALRMVEELDAGPIYLKEDLCLSGHAEEIYIRASELAARMIQRLLAEDIMPTPQVGTPTEFKRRAPADSEVPASESLAELHDLIRMLDAEGYPPAFFERGGLRYEFTRPALRAGRIVADVTITPARERPE